MLTRRTVKFNLSWTVAGLVCTSVPNPKRLYFLVGNDDLKPKDRVALLEKVGVKWGGPPVEAPVYLFPEEMGARAGGKTRVEFRGVFLTFYLSPEMFHRFYTTASNGKSE